MHKLSSDIMDGRELDVCVGDNNIIIAIGVFPLIIVAVSIQGRGILAVNHTACRSVPSTVYMHTFVIYLS